MTIDVNKVILIDLDMKDFFFEADETAKDRAKLLKMIELGSKRSLSSFLSSFLSSHPLVD